MKLPTFIFTLFTWCLISGIAMAEPLFTKNKVPIEAIIFDCDGILVDTEFLKFQSWEKAAAQQGYLFTLEEYKPLVGQSGFSIASAIKTEKDKDFPNKNLDMNQLLADRNIFYEKLHKNPKNIPPILPMIKLAKKMATKKDQHGYKLAVASSAPLAEIQANLSAHGLEKTFDYVISGSDHLKDIQDKEGVNKPKPYIYTRVAEWMGVNPSHCLVFEDTEAGVIASAKANMIVYAVPNDFTMDHNFKLAKKIISAADIQLETLFDE